MKVEDISIIGQNGQELDQAAVERLRLTAWSFLSARDKDVAEKDLPDLWTGDGHLIETRSTNGKFTFTYIPETF